MNILDISQARIVQLPQGSAEWQAYHLAKRNASESAAVLGVSPWTTPYQLWLHKTGRTEPEVIQAMQQETELEPQARAAYEEQTGLVMQPLVLELGDYSASLDGMTLEGDRLLEINCPLEGVHSEFWQGLLKGQLPEHYQVQIQHQLMVSGATSAHLWVYDGQQGILHEIRRDEVLMTRIHQAWEAFQVHLDRDMPPTLTGEDTVQRTDDAWQQAAQAYVQAKREADQVADKLEEARQALLALAQHQKETGAGVTVTRYWKQGNVDYKRIPVLQGLDLSPWRGKSREEVRVTLN